MNIFMKLKFSKNDTLVNSLGSFQYNVTKTGSVIKKFKKAYIQIKKIGMKSFKTLLRNIIQEKTN